MESAASPKHPTFVMHDEHRWLVLSQFESDGEQFYDLVRTIPGKREFATSNRKTLIARLTDCVEWVKTSPNVRKIKDGGFVLEFDGRTMTIRKSRSPTRFPVSLQGVYHAAAKAVAMRARLDKLRAKGKRLSNKAKR